MKSDPGFWSRKRRGVLRSPIPANHSEKKNPSGANVITYVLAILSLMLNIVQFYFNQDMQKNLNKTTQELNIATRDKVVLEQNKVGVETAKLLTDQKVAELVLSNDQLNKDKLKSDTQVSLLQQELARSSLKGQGLDYQLKTIDLYAKRSVAETSAQVKRDTIARYDVEIGARCETMLSELANANAAHGNVYRAYGMLVENKMYSVFPEFQGRTAMTLLLEMSSIGNEVDKKDALAARAVLKKIHDKWKELNDNFQASANRNGVYVDVRDDQQLKQTQRKAALDLQQFIVDNKPALQRWLP